MAKCQLSSSLDDLLASDHQTLSFHARKIRSERHGHHTPSILTFSPKVFLPVTRLCRDTCGYCTFAQAPNPGSRVYMSVEECVAVAEQGKLLGCTEALFTLGEKPEERWSEARAALTALGFNSTLDLVAHIASKVMERTGLIPHINAGTMSEQDLLALKEVSASQGLMLESGSDRLFHLTDGPHPGGTEGCPDKEPRVRIETIKAAGRAKVPFTTGLLIGIGETRQERLIDLMTINKLHQEYGHIQEVIIQPFRAKPGTAMHNRPEPPLEDLLWTIAAARIVMDPSISLQTPPNLTVVASGSGSDVLLEELVWSALIHAGIDDFGGISPLTRDWVNPEKPWPHLERLGRVVAESGFDLLPRLPVYPTYVPIISKGGLSSRPGEWLHRPTSGSVQPLNSVYAAVLSQSDSSGYARGGGGWFAGLPSPEPGPIASLGPPLNPKRNHETLPFLLPPSKTWSVALNSSGTLIGMPKADPASSSRGKKLNSIISSVLEDPLGSNPLADQHRQLLSEGDVEFLLSARGAEHDMVVAAADQLRSRVNGDTVSFVVNRNINYTNICTLACSFCAFSKGKASEDLRGPSYLLPLDEISRRTREAFDRGATEVCLQGGIHPSFDGNTYLDILRAAKEGAPTIHVHAFSPLEVYHGATTLGLPLATYLSLLKDNGLGSLPGTAAEVLDDEVRAVICPDKIDSETWVKVIQAAHLVGLRTTSTLMFGHVEGTRSWARHLITLRDLQRRIVKGGSTESLMESGITEFVPLPFVHMNSPVYSKQGASRRGPTLQECVLLHAVARLTLHPWIRNIQASWVKMGPDQAARLLSAGCNDMGGVLMNESITRAAGAAHGQEIDYHRMIDIICGAGKEPRLRTTLYGNAPESQVQKAIDRPRVSTGVQI